MNPTNLSLVRHSHLLPAVAAGEVPEVAESGGCSASARTEDKVDRLTATVESYGEALARIVTVARAVLGDLAALQSGIGDLKARIDGQDAR